MAVAEVLSGQGTITIRPHGALDAGAAAELRPKLRELLSRTPADVTFDLADTEAVDSSGIGLVVAAFNTVKKVGKTLRVSGASEGVKRVFAAMRLDRHFAVDGAAPERTP